MAAAPGYFLRSPDLHNLFQPEDEGLPSHVFRRYAGFNIPVGRHGDLAGCIRRIPGKRWCDDFRYYFSGGLRRRGAAYFAHSWVACGPSKTCISPVHGFYRERFAISRWTNSGYQQHLAFTLRGSACWHSGGILASKVMIVEAVDDDQSIYGWRGRSCGDCDVFSVSSVFPRCGNYLNLAQTYRSTGISVLSAANA